MSMTPSSRWWRYWWNAGWRPCARNNDISWWAGAGGGGGGGGGGGQGPAGGKSGGWIGRRRVRQPTQSDPGRRPRHSTATLATRRQSPTLQAAWPRISSFGHFCPPAGVLSYELFSGASQPARGHHFEWRDDVNIGIAVKRGDACEKGTVSWILRFLEVRRGGGGWSLHDVQVGVRPGVLGGDEGEQHLDRLDLGGHAAEGETQALQVSGEKWNWTVNLWDWESEIRAELDVSGRRVELKRHVASRQIGQNYCFLTLTPTPEPGSGLWIHWIPVRDSFLELGKAFVLLWICHFLHITVWQLATKAAKAAFLLGQSGD